MTLLNLCLPLEKLHHGPSRLSTKKTEVDQLRAPYHLFGLTPDLARDLTLLARRHVHVHRRRGYDPLASADEDGTREIHGLIPSGWRSKSTETDRGHDSLVYGAMGWELVMLVFPPDTCLLLIPRHGLKVNQPEWSYFLMGAGRSRN